MNNTRNLFFLQLVISKSLYLKDPDGNEVELYVDNPEIDWRNDKRWMDAPVKLLDLDL